RKPWTQIHRATAVAAAREHPDRALVLCWPPFDDDAASYAALRAYRGEVVVYIGERDEGATGSVRFHRELALNWTLEKELDLPRWPRLRDRLMVYRRNPQRRAHVERDRCFECKRFIPTGAIGRCDWCFEQRPTALALRVGRHRVEYPQEMLDAMPPALRKAFERSPNRIRRSPALRRRTPVVFRVPAALSNAPGVPPRPGCPARYRGFTFLRHKETRAVSRLCRRLGDGAAARDALAGRQLAAVLHLLDQQVEGLLRVRLDQLELREQQLVSFQVIAVLDLVQAVRRARIVLPAIVIALRLGRRR